MAKTRGVLMDLGSRLTRGFRGSIATRLSVYLVVILALSGLLFTIVGVQTISSLTVAEAEERVKNDLNTARLIYQDRIDQVCQAVKFSASRTFIDQVFLNEKLNQDYVDELVRFKNNEELDILTFIDKNGVVVLRTNNPTLRGDDLSSLPLIGDIDQTNTCTAGTIILPANYLEYESPDLVEQSHFIFIDTPMAIPRAETEEWDGMMLAASIPVFGNQGEMMGIVFAGKLLNRNYEIVDRVKQTVFQGAVYKGNDIGIATIFQNDVRISTNVKNNDGSRAIGTRVSADVFEKVVVKGEQWIGRAYVVNDWYISAYEPIWDTNDKIIGILYVGILEQKYTDIKNRAALIFSGITLTGAVLAILLALMISRSISSSIRNLVSASKQLANGNLEAKVVKVSNDELGDLADTFNLMATALKDRDEKLKEYAKRKIMESERLALIGQLSANVAHELNNPLQGIVTYSYLLLEDSDCKDESRNMLDKIVVQANRCRDIIRGLLDFSRQKKPDKTLCDVNTLVKGCVSLIDKQALFQNIKLVWKLDENLPRVVLDPSQVERVFLNLIINAAEAMDGTGTLTLTTKHIRQKKIVEIRVQDTGHGILEENIGKIFDPFFTTKETGHGVGLGLAISYGIVKEHNGNLYVESELEKGSTFIVSFPLTASEIGNIDEK